jgi:hypothetical protein
LYFAALSVLRCFCGSEVLLPLLTAPRIRKESNPGLAAWFKGGEGIDWAKEDNPNSGKGKKRASADPQTPFEMAPPLMSHFTKLLKQSRIFSSQAKNLGGQLQDETAIQSILMASDLVTQGEEIEKAAKAMQASFVPASSTSQGISKVASSSSKQKYGGELEMLEEAGRGEWEAKAADLAFDLVPLGEIKNGRYVYKSYKFGQNIQQTTLAPKNALHLSKELASLSTSLPPGIFLRVDESCNLAMKALIVGPIGTPYSQGIFEFDFLLPSDYPLRPPSVQLITTGHGTVRFNPNLYACVRPLLACPISLIAEFDAGQSLPQLARHLARISRRAMATLEVDHFAGSHLNSGPFEHYFYYTH